MSRDLRGQFLKSSALILALLPMTSYLCVAQEITPDLYRELEFRHIGPPGNRVAAVAGVPGDAKIYYAGAASGGIWKSTDGGGLWEPVFDDHPVQSIGALAVAPSDPDIVWAGTGESWIRSNISIGNGVYKSTDGGATWQHMGLSETGRIPRIVIHPRDPETVLVASMGHCYGPQPERGVFRTTDGGRTWEKVLFVDEDTGASDLVMDPNDPQILFAGTWPLIIKTWGRQSGGPGGGVHMSRDGGATWTRLTGNGLPEPPIGKVALGIAPSNSKIVYAMIETGDGVIWRSEDGGENWKLVSRDHMFNERAHYYSRITIAPDNPDEFYTQGVRQMISLDGGKTGTVQMPQPGYDHHDMWIDPLDANRMAVAHDGGVSISRHRGINWRLADLPIAQMYHVAVDNEVPYNVYGNKQDGASHRGPSNYLAKWTAGIPSAMWHDVGGNESGFSIPDPVDTDIIWSGGYDGYLDRFDLGTGQIRSVDVWPEATTGSKAAPVKYRFHWTFPIVISPHDHRKVYVGSQFVHQTRDGGQSWRQISPDLTLNDKSKQQDSGGLTVDNHQLDFFGVVFALAESPITPGVLWAGSNDGLVHVTRNSGKHWTNVTANIPDLPPWGTVSNVEPSKFDAGTCYVTFDFHQVNNRDPYVYRTTDYGETWTSISSAIPKSVFSYAHWIHEDPVRKGMLYLGTENSLFLTLDDGATWHPLQNNLPHAPVHDLVVQKNFNDLVVGTYGRGFWILDDVTPLQQFSQEVVDSAAHLFAPRPAYRLRNKELRFNVPADQCVGQNPPYGASINFYLKSVPAGEVTITILDDVGRTVRQLSGAGVSSEILELLEDLDGRPDELGWFLRVFGMEGFDAFGMTGLDEEGLSRELPTGINRIWWDLRYTPPKMPKLRIIPEKHTHVEFTSKGIRPLRTDHMSRPGQIGPLVAPGTYSVKLAVDGRELTQKLEVKKDPSSAASEDDIREQLQMTLEIQDNINTVVDMIDQIEWVRRQIYELRPSLKGRSNVAVEEAAQELDDKLEAIEEELYPVNHLTGATYDSFRSPHRLYGRLGALAHRVRTSDFVPTEQALELHEVLKGRMADQRSAFNGVLERDVPSFNRMLEDKGLEAIHPETP